MGTGAPLSVIVVTHNEAQNIEECLRTLHWADELIVVDGESNDRTAELARKHTERVFVKANGPCEIQRLYGYERITHEWFLFVDADERVSPALKEQIENVVNRPVSLSACFVLRRNFLKGRPMHMHHPDYQMRLFRKGALKALPTEIHKTPEVEGVVGRLNGPLDHFFFPSVEAYLSKMGRYTMVEASYLLERSDFSPTLWRNFYFFFAKPFMRFCYNYVIKKGFLDGRFGFFLSAGSAYYDMAVYLQYLLLREQASKQEKQTSQAR